MDQSDTLDILDDLVPIMPEAEICLCDTTGRATPDQVHQLFSAAQDRFPQVGRWAMHAHDTYGLGLANVYAAWLAGVRVFDAAVAGLGVESVDEGTVVAARLGSPMRLKLKENWIPRRW